MSRIKETILRYIICSLFLLIILLLYKLITVTPVQFLNVQVDEFLELTAMNRSDLVSEIQRLKQEARIDDLEFNLSLPLNNMTKEEISHIVMATRRKLPINPHHFNYLINPVNKCSGKDVFLFTYVHSNPSHFKLRTFIRETWGNPIYFPGHLVVFLMGKTIDPTIQKSLDFEAEHYQDIIQEEFLDTYRNLTYKNIMGLKWITRHCMHAKVILKADDDIFVNIFNLKKHLESLLSENEHLIRLLLCHVWKGAAVSRDPKNKWYVSKKEYAADRFPTYCAGAAYILSPDVAKSFFLESLKTPFFWIDDFYITGLLAQRLNVTHHPLNSISVAADADFLTRFSGTNRLSLVFGHAHNLNHMYGIWYQVLKDQL